MARFTAILALSGASLIAAQSTIVTISEGLTTTLTLPAFPTPSTTETVTETSTVGVETTTTTTLLPTISLNETFPTTTIGGGSTITALPTDVNTSAISSYISSLLSNATAPLTSTALSNLTTTLATTTTVIGTGTGVIITPNQTTTGALPEFTGAASRPIVGGFAVALAAVVAGVVGL